jgi:alcohol dehydrogenase
VNWCIDAVRKGGNVSVIGAYGPLYSAVKLGDLMNKGLTLRSNQCSVKRHWPRLFEHIRNGHLEPRKMVTHRIPLREIAEGYHMFASKLDKLDERSSNKLVRGSIRDPELLELGGERVLMERTRHRGA